MRATRLLMTIAALATVVGAASAPISVVELDWLDEGLYYYEYTITNPSSSGESAYFFHLDGVDDASIWDTPIGWSALGSGPTYDGWVSWDAISEDYRVAPGESLWGFTIRSPWAPGVGRSSWTIYYTDSSGTDSYDDIGILGPQNPNPPTAVPEPASMALTLLAVGLAGGAARRRRARRED